MEGLTPKKLAEILVEKHSRFMAEYSEEMEKHKLITVLSEKREMLEHWVSSGQGKEKHAKELEDAKKQLNTLKEGYSTKNRAYYDNLKLRIDEHIKARDYWTAKAGEVRK